MNRKLKNDVSNMNVTKSESTPCSSYRIGYYKKGTDKYKSFIDYLMQNDKRPYFNLCRLRNSGIKEEYLEKAASKSDFAIVANSKKRRGYACSFIMFSIHIELNCVFIRLACARSKRSKATVSLLMERLEKDALSKGLTLMVLQSTQRSRRYWIDKGFLKEANACLPWEVQVEKGLIYKSNHRCSEGTGYCTMFDHPESVDLWYSKCLSKK